MSIGHPPARSSSISTPSAMSEAPARQSPFDVELDALVAHARLSKHEVITGLLRAALSIADQWGDEEHVRSSSAINAAVRSGRYVEYAKAWIAELNDPAEGARRWKEEKGLRNNAGVTPEERDVLFEGLKRRAGEIASGGGYAPPQDLEF